MAFWMFFVEKDKPGRSHVVVFLAVCWVGRGGEVSIRGRTVIL